MCQALEDNKTWKLVTLPPGKIPIGCKWVSIVKYKVDGSIKRYKVRLVTKGYNQQEGIHYNQIFTLVMKFVTLRSVLSIATTEGWYVHQMDVYNAFI